MKRQTETVLITGVAGFIGSHLAERLLARGDRVVGVDNFDPFYSRALKERNLELACRNPAFVLVEADCADPAQMRAVFARPFDVVVHLAAKAGVRPSITDPLGYLRANVLATQVLLETAQQHDVSRFIFASSSSVYGNNHQVPFRETDPVEQPISPYAATKRAGELIGHCYHHLHGMGILSLRFFTVYGPRQRPDLAIRKFAELILRGEPVPCYGDGTTERDYTWIDDVLAGVIAAVDRSRERPGEFEIINLGESRTTSLTRLVALIGDALGRIPEIRWLPAQPGDVNRTFADIAKARDLLGYQPETTVEQGIPRFVDWLQQEVRTATR
jgi:UDP-glucuronate 4-epimerase